MCQCKKVLIFSNIVENNAKIKGNDYINNGDKMNKQIIYKMFRETIDDINDLKRSIYKRNLYKK